MTAPCRITMIAAAVAALSACSSPPDSAMSQLEVAAPDSFSEAGDGVPVDEASPWWNVFGDPSLDAHLEAAVRGSLELEQAYARLAQARQSARIAGAARIPSIELSGNVQRLEIDQRGGSGAQIPVRLGETYSLGPSLSYELDLFGRIDAASDSASFAAAATEADAVALQLSLSGQAAEAWFTAVENAALETLVLEQIATGEDLLTVTRSRFQNGAGSALDVLQQQRLIEATRAELPRFLGAAERARHQLAVLSGRAPRDLDSGAVPAALPGLPPMPTLHAPAALLETRPDLVAAFMRVSQADRDVAAAIAARYPRLSLSASYNFDANEIAEMFDRTINVITANLVAPIIDGGERRAEVRRRRAQLDEAIAALNQAFLVALQEVEDSLSLERRGAERVAVLESQREFAAAEVDQARRRYVGGVDTYLQVLAAVQNLQSLDRVLVTERASVLRARAQLLRALGGPAEPAGPSQDAEDRQHNHPKLEANAGAPTVQEVTPS